MFKRVLVPLDGSERAERAIPLAARIAGPSGVVILTRVVATPAEYGPVFAQHFGADVMEADKRSFVGYLTRVAGTPALSGIATETKVLTGSPTSAILELIAEKKADLVVMTSHGRTGLSRWILGSVAQHLAQSAPVPALVLREHGPDLIEPQHAGQREMRILVPLDGSPLAEEAVMPAAALVAAMTAVGALHLMIVVTPYEAYPENMPEALLVDGAKAYLSRVAESVEQAWPSVRVTWEVAVGADADETIIRVSEGLDITERSRDGGYDVIAMATHGRAGFSYVAFGSMTERVLQGTKRPLLIVRSSQRAAQAPSKHARKTETVPPTLDHAHQTRAERFPMWPPLY